MGVIRLLDNCVNGRQEQSGLIVSGLFRHSLNQSPINMKMTRFKLLVWQLSATDAPHIFQSR